MSVGDWASIGISGIQVLIRDQQRLARETSNLVPVVSFSLSLFFLPHEGYIARNSQP